MDQRKNPPLKQQPQTKSKTKSDLLQIIDQNEKIFEQLKKNLMSQLSEYEAAFSRQHNKYTQERDFDHFNQCCQKFKQKGNLFVNHLVEIKNNCTQVIKNMPQEQKLIPTQKHNSFDMFVNEQIDKTLEYKIKQIEYQPQAQRPFQNQLYQFQNQ